MKKISYITTHDTSNYGSVLQTFATQMLFNQCGFESELVDYIRPIQKGINKLKSLSESSSPIIGMAKETLLFPSIIQWKKTLRGFIEKNISKTDTVYYSLEELKKNPPIADIYCTGSDQVWNSDWNKGLEEAYYLRFAPEGKRKISFSASIGREDFAEWEKEKVCEYLAQYDSISVRETTAIDILKNIGINNAVHIVDPTLLISKDIWSAFAAPKLIEENYVLIYQLKRNDLFDKYALDFAKRKHLKLVRLCTRFDRVFLPGKSIIIPNLNEFVSAFLNASYVITDSFHGTAFSLNLNREVICIYPQRFSSRIKDILSDTNMLHRHLENFNDLDIADRKTDFTEVNLYLEGERRKAKAFLDYALRP